MRKKIQMMKALMKVLILLLAIIVVTSKPSICAAKSTTKFKKVKLTRYAMDNIIIYDKPSTKGNKIDIYIINQKIKITGVSRNKKWYRVKYHDKTRYIRKSKDINKKKNKKYKWNGTKLNSRNGRVSGPSGSETYYNLNMSGVVRAMRDRGYSAKKYPYWVTESGLKMLGKYIIVGANYKVHPKGSLVKTSLGTAMVCDTGGFAYYNPTQLDIAVSWR